MELLDHQKEVLPLLGNGKVLWGGVGSGKGITALAYYVLNESPKDVYVITTGKKRDSLDWEKEAIGFGIGTERWATLHGTITIDSWNNIKKYVDVEDAFFIFDEQRLVGSGVWVKSFLKIARKNHWIMLSATPGDTWLEYAPLFIANGFYKNITDFKMQHVLYEPFNKYPKVRGYLNESKLQMLRAEILVEMPFMRHTERYLNWMPVGYDLEKFKKVYKNRWNIFEDKPIKDMSEVWRLMRRVVNQDESRLEMVLELMKVHDKLIIFYNFDYELDILRSLQLVTKVYEYNGHRKDPVPTDDQWVYLVQYMAGAEAWNCTTTDAMILYSLTGSYKLFEQCQGRIDRLDTPFTKLYYYILMSNSIVDRGLKRKVDAKENFNVREFFEYIDQLERCGPDCEKTCQI